MAVFTAPEKVISFYLYPLPLRIRRRRRRLLGDHDA